MKIICHNQLSEAPIAYVKFLSESWKDNIEAICPEDFVAKKTFKDTSPKLNAQKS